MRSFPCAEIFPSGVINSAPPPITRITNDVTQMQMVVFMSLRMLVTAPDDDRG